MNKNNKCHNCMSKLTNHFDDQDFLLTNLSKV
jgi:hypothetical protein